MSLNNGNRVSVALQGFSGIGGYVERPDYDEVSFEASLRSLRARTGDAVTVGDELRTIASIYASPFIRGFVVIELKK